MVSDTRSSRESKDEVDGHSQLKTKKNIRTDLSKNSPAKPGVSGLRRLPSETSVSRRTSPSPQCMQKSRDIPLSRQATPSPQSTRKSKRLERGTLSSPPVNRKTEKQTKNDAATPLRRSDRGKNNLTSSSSGSKKSEKDLIQSEVKRKKKRALIQVTMESEKTELDPEPAGVKRKKMSARIFKNLFKRQRIQEFVPIDDNGELEGPNESSHMCSHNKEGIGSTAMRNRKNGNIDKTLGGALRKHESCRIISQASPGVRETFDCLERISSNENMDAPESESSRCLARSRDGSVSSDSHDEWVHPRGFSPSPPLTCDNQNLMGNCGLCFKNKRVGFQSPEQELCSCNPAENSDPCSFAAKDRNDHGAAVTSESTEKYLSLEVNAASQTVGERKACGYCYKDGKLLCCAGKGCERWYHPCCLDPPLTDDLPGVWHCPRCLKKKILFGVHSVSKGVESIWDVREVDVSNATGVCQKQYLVKYHGLAHIHNHWVPEKQLLLENPSLVANFIEKNKTVRWCVDWTVPHRLLRRRDIHDNIYIASSTVISVCNYEWLVKWRGLNYDHATWELEDAHFLSSSLGQTLINDYETRCQKAQQGVNKHRKGSIIKLSELPAAQSQLNDNLLKNVNKLRECLSKCQNAVVFYDQEQVVTIVCLIQSMNEICWPFLIVTASSLLSHWEAEFAKLVPSVDVVVYSGNEITRKGIRASEFYDEKDHVMLEVLLTSAEALLEDRDMLRSIKWEAIVIDEHQCSWSSDDVEQIKMLNTDSRILLSSGKIKDTTSEYLRILSLLENQGDFDRLRGMKTETNESVCKLRDRLSSFIAYGSPSQVSKFLEYWVPFELSKFQMEQYCATLISNSAPLCSCSRNDSVGVLRDVLFTVRKCCDHPYLLDPSVQQQLIEEKRLASDILDIGIKASGKLQLLDAMLTEIKAQGFQVLILFQSIMGLGGASTGDILDDFLRQRFGQNTYERVDAAITKPSKKQAAVNRFNKNETGQFAFLLETRACSSVIKFSSLDVIVIYDSDWNPANDLRALQKISVESKVGQVKVFRLYSCFTVEERALILAKQNRNLENQLQNFSRTTSDSLLSWGAIDLFRKLDEYHADSNSTSDETSSSDKVLLNVVTKDLRVLLSGSCDDSDLNGVIAKAKLGVQGYTADVPVFGESKVQLKEGEEAYVFWRNLLYGKSPRWKHLSGTSLRNRKRVHYSGGSMSRLEPEKEFVKKHKSMVHNPDAALIQAEYGVNKGPEVSVSKESKGLSAIEACNGSQNLQKDNITPNKEQNCTSGQRSFGAEVSSGEQEGLHNFLRGQMTKLCQILQLSEDITFAVSRFLEYVIKNHHVNTDSPSILQAFQISLCWIAASIRKQKVFKKDSLMLAKQLLNYQCTEEQVNSVYSKMRLLKRMYLQSSENDVDSDLQCLLGTDDTSQEPSNASQGSPHKQIHEKMKLGECSGNEEHVGLQKNLALADIRKVLKKYEKRMKKLTRRHQAEIEEFHRIWDEKRMKLETDHKLESALIRSIHEQGSLRINKLKLLEENFAKKMETLNLLKNSELKDLEAKQSAALNVEKQKVDQLAKVEVFSRELRAVDGPESLGSQSEDDAGALQPSAGINIMSPSESFPIGQHKDQTQHKGFHSVENDARPSVISESAPTETPLENLSTVNLQNDAGVMPSSLDMTEHLNQSKNPCVNGKTVLGNQSAPGELGSDEDQPVDAPGEFVVVPETVVSETAELSNASEKELSKGSKIALSDALVRERDEPYAAASVDLQNLEQTSDYLEDVVSVPDCSESLQQQVQQDTVCQSLASADAPALQIQNTLHSEVTIAEPIDTAAISPSNHEATVSDEILTTLPSNNEALGTENYAVLHPPSADAALNCDESPAAEDHDHGRSSSPTAEIYRGQLLSHESTSQAGESLEAHGIDVDIRSMTDVSHGESIELSELPQNNATATPVSVSSAEQTNQGVQSAGIFAGHGPGSLVPTHPLYWNPTQSLLPDPLQIELERMRKETEQLETNHTNLISQLNLECEKEIQETIAQIRNRYELKLEESEAEYRSKKQELDKNKKKVLADKLLAAVFRSKCVDVRASGHPGMPSSLTQRLHQARSPPSVRPYLVASSSQPDPSLQITTPPMRPVLSPPQPHPVRPFPASGQSAATSPAQPVQRAPLIPGGSSRPPVINNISPSGNPHVSGEIRARPPHLQPFRSRAPIPVSTSPLTSQLQPQQMVQSHAMQPSPSPPARPLLQPNMVSQETLTAPPNQSIPTLGSAMETDYLRAAPQMFSSRSIELSAFENLGLVQSNLESATAAGVVCLSDDE